MCPLPARNSVESTIKRQKTTKQEENEVSNERTSKSYGNWSPSDVQNWRKKRMVYGEWECVHVTGYCRTEGFGLQTRLQRVLRTCGQADSQKRGTKKWQSWKSNLLPAIIRPASKRVSEYVYVVCCVCANMCYAPWQTTQHVFNMSN